MQKITPDWPAPAHIKAFTTTRNGGFSEGPYRSFNLAHHVDDNPEHVAKNRKLMMDEFHLPAMPTWINQVHGVEVLALKSTANTADETIDPGYFSPHEKFRGTNHSQITHTKLECDAVFTTLPGKVCAVMTADCLPLFITNTEGNAVAAIHAGWKGLAAGVIDSAVKQFTKQHSPQQLLVYLGPALGPCCFAVGSEVIETFVQRIPDFIQGFRQQGEQWYGDMYALARINLHHLGIPATHIYGGIYCTNCDSELFFSYRRDQGVTGRMCSLIYIDN